MLCLYFDWKFHFQHFKGCMRLCMSVGPSESVLRFSLCVVLTMLDDADGSTWNSLFQHECSFFGNYFREYLSHKPNR